MRASGIDIIGAIPWGTHICHFFETKEDILSIILPFFKAGLENNEYCIWLVTGPLTVEEATNHLRSYIPNFDTYLTNNQIEIFNASDWYKIKNKKFDISLILQQWSEKVEQSKKKRYSGVRASGIIPLLNDVEWESIIEYEFEVNASISKRRLIAICSYNTALCNGNDILDVINSHSFGLIKKRGIWKIIESSENKKQEDAVRESEEKYRNIFETAPNLITSIDKNGMIVDCNGRMSSILGYSCEELINQPMAKIIHPHYLAKAEESLNEIFTKGYSSNKECKMVRKDGEIIDVNVNSAGLRNKDGEYIQAICIIENITERKKAEEMLLFTQFSIDHVSDALYWIDSEARFIYINNAASKMLGYTKEELLSMSVFDIDPNINRNNWKEHWEKTKNSRFYILQTTHITKDKKVVPIEVTVNYIEYNGKEYHVDFARDITERKRSEVQMLQTKKLESLGVLAGGIAHDFNNLLMGVLGNASLALVDLPSDSSARKRLEQIEKISQRATDLTSQMLAYSGRGKFVIQPINLSVLIKEMNHLIEVSIPKNITLRYNLNFTIPTIEADITQIRQVIMNLITNASDAIGDSNGDILVSTGSMVCDNEFLSKTYLSGNIADDEYTYIEITDNGCGIDEKDLNKIFDPFFSTKFAGRGLGLAAILGIVRSHHGTIAISSELGKGATFKVLFPSSKREHQVNDKTTSKPMQWEGNGTILVVDDEENIRNVAKEILKRVGFKVLTAADGREGVEVFRKFSNEIKLVLLDMMMPNMNGEEALREIRSIKEDACILLTSGYSEENIAHQFSPNELAGFIQKPYKVADLLAKLREILK